MGEKQPQQEGMCIRAEWGDHGTTESLVVVRRRVVSDTGSDKIHEKRAERCSTHYIDMLELYPLKNGKSLKDGQQQMETIILGL